VSTASGLGWGVADAISTLSQVIHSDVVSLGERTEQVHILTERLQSHANRELRH
jgi:hypothetical protein